MGIQPQAGAVVDDQAGKSEPREASGLTTHLVLDFVEREGGRDALEQMLEHSGLQGREEELRDENRWFADETRVRLFESAAVVLDDPGVGRRIGESALDRNVGQTLKISLRALGTPRLLYANVGRANAKFNRVHQMDVLDVGPNHARIRNVPLGDVEWHACDCDYNLGLLSCAPLVFGRLPARVRHPRCIGAGDDECIYEVEWSTSDRPTREIVLISLAFAGLVASALFATSLLPVAIAVSAVIAVYTGARAMTERRRRIRLLQAQVSEQHDAADLLMGSMQDLVSALQLDEVLSKITSNAQAAVGGGAEFALLAAGQDGLGCRSSSQLDPQAIATLEAWASSSADILQSSTRIDDLSTVPELATLPLDRAAPLGSLCAAPLKYRDQTLGVLVALAASKESFFPRDVALLSSYAAQAAIALTNATLYEAQQELAIQDPLTNLFNHRHFHETLSRELDRCRRHGGDLGLVLFDLDDFKQVNDTGGHAEGDEVLCKVAESLRRTGRRSDMPFRVGGDEFALILPSTGRVHAEAAARRAAEAISTIDARTSVSYGVASWPTAGPTKDALLAAADASLYEMKRRVENAPVAKRASGDTISKHDRLASTSRTAIKLAPLLDEVEIAEKAVAELQDTFEYQRIVVHRVEAGGSLMAVARDGQEAGGFLTSPSAVSGSGAPERAAHGGEAVLINDDTGAGGQAMSVLATPIRVDGDAWGVLELVHAEAGRFDFDDVLFADTIAAAVGAAIHRGQLYAELEGAFMRTLAVLCDALEAKDSYTAAHAREVSDLAERVGRALGMEADELRTLSYGALLHDIGKIAIRSEILHKPGSLTDAEYEEMKAHTVIGAQMLERIPYFADVHPLVRSSHEQWDGSGYPDQASGESIPLGSRIIAACDAFHAMTSDRPYRAAMDSESAIAELRRHAGSQFDPDVIEILVELLGESSLTEGEPATATH